MFLQSVKCLVHINGNVTNVWVEELLQPVFPIYHDIGQLSQRRVSSFGLRWVPLGLVCSDGAFALSLVMGLAGQLLVSLCLLSHCHTGNREGGTLVKSLAFTKGDFFFY